MDMAHWWLWTCGHNQVWTTDGKNLTICQPGEAKIKKDQHEPGLKVKWRNQALRSQAVSIRPKGRKTQPSPTLISSLNQTKRQKDATKPYCHKQSQSGLKAERRNQALLSQAVSIRPEGRKTQPGPTITSSEWKWVCAVTPKDKWAHPGLSATA